jgi:hypothetical protein
MLTAHLGVFSYFSVMHLQRLLPLAILISSFSASCFAQLIPAPSAATIISRPAIDSLLPAAVKQQLGIHYPVFKTYRYNDQGGEHYLVLTEKEPVIREKDTATSNIEGFCLTSTATGLTQDWRLKDVIDTALEMSIYFWAKYVSVIDLDGDGYVDPLVVYGTQDRYNTDEDHRLKLLLYYKGKKVAIRAVTGDLDGTRSVEYDKSFAELPAVIRAYEKQLLNRISREQGFILH